MPKPAAVEPASELGGEEAAGEEATGPLPATQLNMHPDLTAEEEAVLAKVMFITQEQNQAAVLRLPVCAQRQEQIFSLPRKPLQGPFCSGTQKGGLLGSGPTEVNAEQPLSPGELGVLQHCHFARKGAGQEEGGREAEAQDFFVFFYKKPWGPDTKHNSSVWHPSKESAAQR